MICPNCGTENLGSNKFCTECGCDLAAAQIAQSSVNQQTAAEQPNAELSDDEQVTQTFDASQTQEAPVSSDAEALNEAKEILQQAAGKVDVSGISKENQKKAVLMQAAKEIAAGKYAGTHQNAQGAASSGSARTGRGSLAEGVMGEQGGKFPMVLAIISLVMGILCIPCMCITLLKHPAYQLLTILCATICGLFALIKGYEKKAIPIIGMALGCISFLCWLVVIIFG